MNQNTNKFKPWVVQFLFVPIGSVGHKKSGVLCHNIDGGFGEAGGINFLNLILLRSMNKTICDVVLIEK